MTCKIDGCGRKAEYKADMVCQKHYFRFWRYGTYELTAKPGRYRYTHSSGYQLVKEPGHPLANKTGYVYEHRKIMFEIYGESLPDCELCGKECNWDIYTTHIDHINGDKSDNRPENLRPLCNACNSQRDIDPIDRHNSIKIEIDGVVNTANGWAKHPKSNHSNSSILRRIRLGLDPKDAVFGENQTHPKNRRIHAD